VSRAGRIFQGGLLALLSLIALAVGAAVWFFGSYYPTMGLAGISRQDYRSAMETVSKSRATAEDLRFVAVDSLTLRESGKDGDARVWGVARCLGKDGSTSFFWVSLTWDKGKGQWRRGAMQQLAAPDDEIYFTREFPGQLTRARLALSKIGGQLAARVREARGWQRLQNLDL
jgi:hypothetical protein